MKKYKLLKDLPNIKAGAIFEEKNNSFVYARSTDSSKHYRKKTVINNPEWFEKVDGFLKEFEVYERNYNSFGLSENFKTKEQAEAMKDLKQHIYKFDEPNAGEDFFILYAGEVFISNDNISSIYSYRKILPYMIKYKSGVIMNKNTTEEDREERIRLLKAAYDL